MAHSLHHTSFPLPGHVLLFNSTLNLFVTINPQCACAAWIMVLGLSVCLCVCTTILTPQATGRPKSDTNGSSAL